MKKNPLRQHVGQPTTALIFTRLTAEDLRRFHAAKISYSGATGDVTDRDRGWVSYIATFLKNLEAAVSAMGWKKFRVKRKGHQWTVSRKRRR